MLQFHVTIAKNQKKAIIKKFKKQSSKIQKSNHQKKLYADEYFINTFRQESAAMDARRLHR
jgi:hypothetical protein